MGVGASFSEQGGLRLKQKLNIFSSPLFFSPLILRHRTQTHTARSCRVESASSSRLWAIIKMAPLSNEGVHREDPILVEWVKGL